MSTGHYDAALSSISFGGIPITGFTDGEFMSIAPEADLFTDRMGADGEGARARSNDTRATLTLTLLASSATNDLLSARFREGVRGENGADVGAFSYRDNSGRTVCSATSAWINRIPDVTRGVEVGEVVWTIRLHGYSADIGGNIDVDGTPS